MVFLIILTKIILGIVSLVIIIKINKDKQDNNLMEIITSKLQMDFLPINNNLIQCLIIILQVIIHFLITIIIDLVIIVFLIRIII